MQQRNLGKAMRYLVVVCALVSAFAMVGCGGDGDDDGAATTTSNVSNAPVPVNASTVQAVVGKQFIIPDGSIFSAGLQPNQLTLTFDTPTTFTLSGVGIAAGTRGTVAFTQSCTFTITTGTLAGTTIPTFTTCDFLVTATAPLQQGGATGQATVILQLGRGGVVLISAPFPAGVTITVSIDASGQLILNNVPTGITISPTTGTTGTGGTP